MPKYVDHGEHRAAVVAAAIDFIADHGLKTLSVRVLARHMRCSPSVVSHYFSGRTDLLQHVYRAAIDESAKLQQSAFENQVRSPIQALEDILPVTERSRRIWRVWFCFWADAIYDRTLAIEHRDGLSTTRNGIQAHLEARGATAADARTSAEDLMQAVLGIAAQAIFDPENWDANRQLAAYRRAAARALRDSGIEPSLAKRARLKGART